MPYAAHAVQVSLRRLRSRPAQTGQPILRPRLPFRQKLFARHANDTARLRSSVESGGLHERYYEARLARSFSSIVLEALAV